MLFSLFFSLINLIQETTLKTCQNNNAFTIKKFDFSYPHVIRAKKITYNIFAEISSHVENPFLETQIIPEEGRIPIFRIDDSLCRKGVIKCPTYYSLFLYKNTISLPATIPPGNYIFRLFFREAKQKIACFEKTFRIVDNTTKIARDN